MIISLYFDTEVLASSEIEARDLVSELLSKVEDDKVELISEEVSNYDFESKEDTGEEEDTFTLTFEVTYETTYTEQELIEQFEDFVSVSSHLNYLVEGID